MDIKKVFFITILTVLISGCLSSSTGGGSGLDGETDPKKVITEIGDIDSGILLTIISSPNGTISTNRADFKFIAQQDGYSSSDFLYNYKIREEGSSTWDEEKSLYDDGSTKQFVDDTSISFVSLDYDEDYEVEIVAFNKETKKVSASKLKLFSTGSETSVDDDLAKQFREDIDLESVTMNKTNYLVEEIMEITYRIRNNGNNTREIEMLADFGSTWQGSWEKSSGDNSYEILPGETKYIEESYTLKSLAQSDSVSEEFVTLGVKDIDSSGEVSVNPKTILIFNSARMGIDITEIYMSKSSVVPGDDNINISFRVAHANNNVTAYIEEIKCIFTTEDGTDVSSDWTLASYTGDLKISPGIGTVTTFNLKYTLSSNATPGKISVDGYLKARLGDVEFIEVESANSEIIDTVNVLEIGKGTINMWMAYPEGALDGEISAGQEFAIYATADYNGSVSFSDYGQIELDLDGLDGVRLVTGDRTSVINFGDQYQWILKAGDIPIEGDIRLYIKREPELSNEAKLEFVEDEVTLGIKVVEKPVLNVEYGIYENEYGGIEDTIKAGSTFKMYAKAVNESDNKVSGNVKFQIDLSSFTDLELANGESEIKEVAVDSYAIWELKAPPSDRTSTVYFDLLDVPKDPNTGEEVTYFEGSNPRVTVRMGGLLVLRSVQCDWDSIDPGRDAVPIKFEYENRGSIDVKVTDVKADFVQNGVDVSDKWILTETTIKDNTMAKTNGEISTVTAYYRLMENIYDGSDLLGDIIVNGEISGYDIVSHEEMTDQMAKFGDIIEVNDIVPPTAVATADNTEVEVFTEITFSGKDSSDNKAVTNYYWDFDQYDDIYESVAGEEITHTYSEPGIYFVNLTVNDEARNGGATVAESQSLIKITVVDTTAPEAKPYLSTSGTLKTGVPVSFDGRQSSDNYQISKYSWDFGDGTVPHTSSTPVHTYYTAGTYTVTLTVTDTEGNEGEATLSVTIE